MVANPKPYQKLSNFSACTATFASGSSEGDDDGAHDDLADSDDSGAEDGEEPLENGEDDNESMESEVEEGYDSDVIVEVPRG